VGGVACTKKVPGPVPGTFVDLNYGVQGGSPPAHQNILALMKVFGEEVDDCTLRVSFGKKEFNWRNYQDSHLQQTLKKDIARFGTLLKVHTHARTHTHTHTQCARKHHNNNTILLLTAFCALFASTFLCRAL
jgi:hypothetical protein